MKFERASGVLLHVTSLPGNSGTGTMGKEAPAFIDLLARAGQSWWQILPIGPVTEKNSYSPYASSSAFAGNPLFIDLKGISSLEWCRPAPVPPEYPENHFADFRLCRENSTYFLKEAFRLFFINAGLKEQTDFKQFTIQEKAWLDDWALFAAFSDLFGTADWTSWDRPFALRDRNTLESYPSGTDSGILYHKFIQWLFYGQWKDMKQYALSKNIRIIGDIPIYITLDSADAWAAGSEILSLDPVNFRPIEVAGVPPDYFSDTGQRWGNPLYKWENGKGLNETLIKWWAARISHLMRFVDAVRIDHFRAFDSYWAIPSGEETAINGEWIKGPGIDFFRQIESLTGPLNLIAEDLGIITPEVEKLRDELDLPGMKILQFAFDGSSKNPYLPHNIKNRNCVFYTGTHDNNTSNGWFYGEESGSAMRAYVREYSGCSREDSFHAEMLRMVLSSTADLSIIPAQDIPGYGAEHRMNTPGTMAGNWTWKLRKDSLREEYLIQLKRMCELYGRIPANRE